MARTIAVGEQDFVKIIEQNYFYIDKTNRLFCRRNTGFAMLVRSGRYQMPALPADMHMYQQQDLQK